MKDSLFYNKVKARWQEYRKGAYSNLQIESKIDSLYNVLTSFGAEERNAKAWGIWQRPDGEWEGPLYVWPNKYISSSYQDELDYLKWWIFNRVEWMDKQFSLK